MHSEIFDEFVKIAKEKEDSDKVEKTDKSRNSSFIQDIAKLYNLKPETHTDMEYENNMAEIAHPSPMVISPSYDIANGLVENVNERHALIKKILEKDPRGQHTGKRTIAEIELSKNLFKLGSEFSSTKNKDLAALADASLKSLNKTAFWNLALPIARLIGGAIMTMSVSKYLPQANMGFQRNSDELVSELNDLVTSNTNWGVGKKYKPEFIAFVKEIISTITNFNAAYNKGAGSLTSLDIKGAKEIIENSETVASTTENNEKVLAVLLKSAQQMSTYIAQISSMFNDDKFIRNQVADSGALTKSLEKNVILNTVSDLIDPSDDVADIKNSLKAYSESIDEIISTIQQTDKTKEHYTNYTDQMIAQYKKINPGDANAPEAAPKTDNSDENIDFSKLL